MKLHPTLLAVSALLALLSSFPARADDGVLSFELAEPQWANEALVAKAEAEALAAAPAPDLANQPLPIPAQAVNPPMRYHSPQQLPAGVYRRGVAVALNESTSATALLPPAPPAPDMVLVAAAPPETQPEPQPEPKAEPQEPPAILALDFGMEPSPAVLTARAELAKPKQPANPLLSLFDGDSDSLVAWAVGSAEGTRTPNGAINPAYFGHTDPGNRVWNMGTFSYQHGASTPTEADQKQLARLKNQGDVLRQRALKHGLNLTLEETLNGLDLANQSPLASIGRVGYIERLAEAKANGYEGGEAILVARTRSYINPNTGRWNAPGLGNTEPSIRRDQKRRADAVAKAIAAYEAKAPDLQPQTWTLIPSTQPETLVALGEPPAEAIDDMLQMWTSPSDPVAQSAPELEEAVAAEPATSATSTDISAAPIDDRLAALWQITVDRFAPIGGDNESVGDPQVASLAIGLFSRAPGGDSPTAVGSVVDAEANMAEASGAEANGAQPSDASAALAPIAIPTWAETREAEQNTPATPAPQIATPQPIPGAVPHSAVYVPTAAPDANPEFAEELVLQPELSASKTVPEKVLRTAPETDPGTEPEKSSESAIAPPAEFSEQTEPAETFGEVPQSDSKPEVTPEQLPAIAAQEEPTVAPHPALAAAEGAAVEPSASPAEVPAPEATLEEDQADAPLGFDRADLQDLTRAPQASETVPVKPAPGDLPALSAEQGSSAEGHSKTQASDQ